VKKIVAALLNTVQQDGRSLPPDRLTAVTSYAQQTEAETFNTAISHEDYFHRLAERLYKIQKDYEEKQMSKKQQILTTTLTSIDKSAGEQGPPNRIAPQSDYSSTFLPSTTTTQIKSETHTPNPTQSLPFDTHRISTDSLNRMTIHNNNSNMISHADTNGTHLEMKHIKTEQISPNHDTKIQVNRLHFCSHDKSERHLLKLSFTEFRKATHVRPSVPPARIRYSQRRERLLI
jgi:hypothetical protein